MRTTDNDYFARIRLEKPTVIQLKMLAGITGNSRELLRRGLKTREWFHVARLFGRRPEEEFHRLMNLLAFALRERLEPVELKRGSEVIGNSVNPRAAAQGKGVCCALLLHPFSNYNFRGGRPDDLERFTMLKRGAKKGVSPGNSIQTAKGEWR